ncbi:aminopeptidase P family protein [Clostridium oceanicum]|uniref:Aminopeptidase P family protein n=1 Tax=Clostridium oceanicum TaxID=1543 RepID=A0ABP3UTX4_9CLOT
MVNRIIKIKSFLNKTGIDGILIKGKSNKKYISKLGGSGVKVFITKKDAYIIADARYIEEANKICDGFKIIDHKGEFYTVLNSIVEKENIEKIAIERIHSSIDDYFDIKEKINSEIILLNDELEEIRKIKEDIEIDKIKKACQITDYIFEKVLSKIKEGVSERDISAEIQYLAIKEGASAMSFDTIVASGYRSAMPHGRPTNKKILKGEAIVIDFGIIYEDYMSDMTRTVFIDSVPEKIKNIYNVVLKAQLKSIDFIKEGVAEGEVDSIAREYIKEKGYGKYFGHGLGHGIGMGENELPVLKPNRKGILKNNMVMSVEPGIYIPNIGGVRIEDDVVVKGEKGIPLNKTTKEIIIL